jgi:hypothetical protein
VGIVIRKLKERIMLALATLTTQGRALGYSSWRPCKGLVFGGALLFSLG